MLTGGMAERSMAVVLKTTKVQAFGGSNPSPSAIALIRRRPQRTAFFTSAAILASSVAVNLLSAY